MSNDKNNKLAAWKGGVSGYSPLNIFHDEVDSLFDSVFNSWWTDPLLVSQRNYRVYDIVNNENDYTISVEIPGYKRSEIKLEVVNNSIQLTAENSKGKYIKAWKLSNVDFDKITSKLEDGVLSITAPKTPESKPKVIDIQEIK